MTETYGLLVHKSPQFQNTPTRRGIYPSGTKSSLLIVTITGTHERVKEAIHIRLHRNNINRDSGIEIPEAWIPTIRKHNSRTVRMRTFEGTAYSSLMTKKKLLLANLSTKSCSDFSEMMETRNFSECKKLSQPKKVARNARSFQKVAQNVAEQLVESPSCNPLHPPPPKKKKTINV